MRTYTIVDYFGYDLSPKERMRSIRLAGFDGVILLWADYFDRDFRDFPAYADKEGLFVENAHAPYKQANTIWCKGTAGDAYTDHLIECIRECAGLGIPTLVVHPVNGMTPLPDSSVGIERFRRILDAAEKADVNIAIENQGNPAYIGYMFEQIQSDKLRFCFDSGHEHFYSPREDLLARFGDRLSALHLHDNDGTDDAHALPYTGSVDFARLAAHLHRIEYPGAIALETLNRGFETITDPVEFLRIALERAKRILEKA